MSWWRPLTVSLVLVGAVAVGLAGCSSEDTPAAPTDPVLLEGQQIFSSQCAGCHGRAGGGGFGSKLSDGQVVENYPDIADQIAVIADGQGGMPGFEGRLTDAQLEAVALYTREVL
ncbi:c-type cytochrome [Rhabdothermincola salaria]|uniref:c-type cytochrome n=1 Tax=Rhabdothermincola salaria TaxID=2903142 RepID=UPI001E29ED88|nr:c-type cytochrome [Rhabdothermincola salaria]MCD9624934.1 c-type cytochrome [Rhabdothermincola salaria]